MKKDCIENEAKKETSYVDIIKYFESDFVYEDSKNTSELKGFFDK